MWVCFSHTVVTFKLDSLEFLGTQYLNGVFNDVLRVTKRLWEIWLTKYRFWVLNLRLLFFFFFLVELIKEVSVVLDLFARISLWHSLSPKVVFLRIFLINRALASIPIHILLILVEINLWLLSFHPWLGGENADLRFRDDLQLAESVPRCHLIQSSHQTIV